MNRQSALTLSERLSQVSGKLRAWWEHEDQKNPCINMLALKDDHEEIPDTDDLERFWMDSDFVIKRRMALIDNINYYGQSVPYHYVDFGASAMPCALGAEAQFVNKETIWAHPKFETIDEIFDVPLSMENAIYSKIIEVTKKSAQLSSNHHFVTPYALNGITDILAGLYGTENLLIDMMSNKRKVKKAMEYFKCLWIKAFNDIQEIIRTGKNRGCVGWAGIWAPGTTFPMQEDLTYMISPDLFREFCIPHIHDLIDSMDYSLYHLDGIGAIGHLDALLEIKKLHAIQWVPGAGHERLDQWYDLIKRILGAGKSIQVYAQADEVESLIKNVGSKGVLISIPDPFTLSSNAEAQVLLEKYGN